MHACADPPPHRLVALRLELQCAHAKTVQERALLALLHVRSGEPAAQCQPMFLGQNLSDDDSDVRAAA